MILDLKDYIIQNYILHPLRIERKFLSEEKFEVSNRKQDYREYYTDKTKINVEDLYKRDIDRFGYSF